MIPVTVRDIKIGEGIPKICVPIVGRTQTEIIKLAKECTGLPLNLVEWRADWFEDVKDISAVLKTVKELRKVLGDIPLLFTFRTAKEGGQCTIEKDMYKELNIAVSASGLADLIDVEVFAGKALVKEVIEEAHKYGALVIASNHDFEKTPPKEELIDRLMLMQQLGADILKIAVMPRTERDVLTLLDATCTMKDQYAKCPLITMSMAGLGALSRICGETFGSAVTFASARKASAPGQIDVKALAGMLEILHT